MTKKHAKFSELYCKQTIVHICCNLQSSVQGRTRVGSEMSKGVGGEGNIEIKLPFFHSFFMLFSVWGRGESTFTPPNNFILLCVLAIITTWRIARHLLDTINLFKYSKNHELEDKKRIKNIKHARYQKVIFCKYTASLVHYLHQ